MTIAIAIVGGLALLCWIIDAFIPSDEYPIYPMPLTTIVSGISFFLLPLFLIALFVLALVK